MLPQLDYTTYSSQLFWLSVNFSILYGAVSLFIIPKLDGIMKKRLEVLRQNDKKTQQNSDLILCEQEKYQVATDKATSLAQDINRDNDIMMGQHRSRVYEKLSSDIKKLNTKNEKECARFKSEIKSDLVGEVINITSLYYQQLIHENINKDDISHTLKKQIEEEL